MLRLSGRTHLQRKQTQADTREQGADWVPIVLVGNKCDIRDDQRQVSEEDGRKLAEEFKCGFVETSAKGGTKVERSFELMIIEIEKMQNPNEPMGGQKCLVM